MSENEPTRHRIDNEFLDSVLIGGREPVKIVVVDYDPSWPERFEQERARLQETLKGQVRRIEHIGSTSVPGLAAKPIVDILVTVDDVEPDTALVSSLEVAGFVLRVREPGHRMFRTPERDVHVHVYSNDAIEIEHYLLLRDWLRHSPQDRALYERTKRELAKRDWSDMNDYADAKSDVIAAILGRASDRRREISG